VVAGPLAIYCTHDPDACELAAQTFTRDTGIAVAMSVARGEVGIGVSFVHEFVTQQLVGFPVDIVIPREGTGAALGGMAIIANGPNPADARAFYDWAPLVSAQEIANRTRNLILPANKSAEIRAEAALYAGAATVEVDPSRFGTPAEKRRLLARWQREIGDALK